MDNLFTQCIQYIQSLQKLRVLAFEFESVHLCKADHCCFFDSASRCKLVRTNGRHGMVFGDTTVTVSV